MLHWTPGTYLLFRINLLSEMTKTVHKIKMMKYFKQIQGTGNLMTAFM